MTESTDSPPAPGDVAGSPVTRPRPATLREVATAAQLDISTVSRALRPETRNRVKPEGCQGPDGPVMPARVISKPPTAELRPGQRDEDSLPPYSLLDRILEGLVDKEMSVKEVALVTGAELALIADIETKLLRAEYKRRQAPPGVKIGSRNFGRDRRYPISNFFHTGPQRKQPS